MWFSSFPPLCSPLTLADGAPTFMIHLLSWFKSWKHPWRHDWRWVSQVILNPGKLPTMSKYREINDQYSTDDVCGQQGASQCLSSLLLVPQKNHKPSNQSTINKMSYADHPQSLSKYHCTENEVSTLKPEWLNFLFATYSEAAFSLATGSFLKTNTL